jgi:bacillopeptidase F
MGKKILTQTTCIVFFLGLVAGPLFAGIAAVHGDPARVPMQKVMLVFDSAGFNGDISSLSHADQMRYLKVRALASQARVLRFLEIEKRLGRVRDYRRFWISNAVWVDAQKSLIDELSAYYDVSRVLHGDEIQPQIGPDGAGMRSTEEGLTVMGADSLWKAGLTGLGRIACIIDTGVDGMHPSLSERWRGAQEGVDWSEVRPGRRHTISGGR